MSQRYTLIIPHWHPARKNQFLYTTVRQRIRLKKLDRTMIMGYALQAKIPAAAGKRRLSLHIILGKGQKGGDVDAYFHSLLDACKHAKLIVDDTHVFAEIAPVTFSRDWQQWGTMVTIEELSGESDAETDTGIDPSRL